MTEIKKGALVKAWNEDPSNFVMGYYCERIYRGIFYPHLISFGDLKVKFENAIEIPEGLAKQLEELGK